MKYWQLPPDMRELPPQPRAVLLCDRLAGAATGAGVAALVLLAVAVYPGALTAAIDGPLGFLASGVPAGAVGGWFLTPRALRVMPDQRSAVAFRLSMIEAFIGGDGAAAWMVARPAMLIETHQAVERTFTSIAAVGSIGVVIFAIPAAVLLTPVSMLWVVLVRRLLRPGSIVV